MAPSGDAKSDVFDDSDLLTGVPSNIDTFSCGLPKLNGDEVVRPVPPKIFAFSNGLLVAVD